METKVFLRKPMFTEYVQSLKPEFDAVKTNGLYDYTFIDTKGVEVKSRCAKELFEAMNERFGYFINPEMSSNRRSKWIVTFDDKKPTTKVVDVVEVDEDEVMMSVSSSEPAGDVKEVETTIDESLSFDLIDWPRVEAYKNTKSDKSELESYASKFGVSLKKNMKVENMVEVFKLAGVEL